MGTIHDYLNARRGDLVEELKAWIRLPSVAGPPQFQPALARSANWLASALQEIGFPTVAWAAPSSSRRCSTCRATGSTPRC
jgi:acetylornithine deacetylase/succinyl-diaminopimelate desuccinylase-like protein